MFEEMVKKVVRLNQEWIPTYESGATLYIRPLLIGTSPQVGVHPSKEYCFLIFVTPVGPYFKGGFSTNPYVIIRDFDRSAPLGTGIYKVGGNYAASLRANNIAHEKGYACEFYLDAKAIISVACHIEHRLSKRVCQVVHHATTIAVWHSF